MREIVREGSISILRFDRGEEILTGLASFARESRIHAGTFQGLGAALKEIIVSGTCEVRFEGLSGKLERRLDLATGLNLMA